MGNKLLTDECFRLCNSLEKKVGQLTLALAQAGLGVGKKWNVTCIIASQRASQYRGLDRV